MNYETQTILMWLLRNVGSSPWFKNILFGNMSEGLREERISEWVNAELESVKLECWKDNREFVGNVLLRFVEKVEYKQLVKELQQRLTLVQQESKN